MVLGEDSGQLYEERLRRERPKKTIFHGQEAIDKINEAIQKGPPDKGDAKTYCVDFDGVLSHHESGWPLEKIGPPLSPGIKMAKRIKAAGHRLVILTARPKHMHETING